MSNIYINRNRSQGAYGSPIVKQKFNTPNETWYSRGQQTKQGMDTFYKTSLKFGANPDLSPKHVGMQWSIVDACDTVKFNQQQMEEKYKKTETSMPLWKAYNTFENPKQTYEQRTDLYPGPGSPKIHPSMQSNGFVNYQNSGGISRKDHLRDQINSIAQKIAEAKQIKGTLCLNNGKSNGGTWKTPSLDVALKNKSGFKGGETAQRFYMKFPIYRPRGEQPPQVTDDISSVLKEQLSMNNDSKPNYLVETSYRSTIGMARNKSINNRDDIVSILSDKDGSLRYNKMNGRSNSITQDIRDPRNMLKMAGRNTITFPRRERFNEDTQSVIAEQRQKQQEKTLTEKNLGTRGITEYDLQSKFSKTSRQSNKSLTKSELTKFFSNGQKKVDEETKSRKSVISQMSKGSTTSVFKTKFLKKIDQQSQEQMDKVEELTYESDQDIINNPNGEEDQDDQEEQDDAATVASSVIDNLSMAPTDVLANEYKKLIEQYDTEIQNRKNLEQQVERLRTDSEAY